MRRMLAIASVLVAGMPAVHAKGTWILSGGLNLGIGSLGSQNTMFDTTNKTGDGIGSGYTTTFSSAAQSTLFGFSLGAQTTIGGGFHCGFFGFINWNSLSDFATTAVSDNDAGKGANFRLATKNAQYALYLRFGYALTPSTVVYAGVGPSWRRMKIVMNGFPADVETNYILAKATRPAIMPVIGAEVSIGKCWALGVLGTYELYSGWNTASTIPKPVADDVAFAGAGSLATARPRILAVMLNLSYKYHL